MLNNWVQTRKHQRLIQIIQAALVTEVMLQTADEHTGKSPNNRKKFRTLLTTTNYKNSYFNNPKIKSIGMTITGDPENTGKSAKF